MLGYLTTSDHQVYRVTPLKTPFGLLICLFAIFTFTLANFSAINYFLQTITDFTSSHFETLAEILLREFTS
jgi:hypothetical protein